MHTSHFYGGSDGDDGDDLESAFRRSRLRRTRSRSRSTCRSRSTERPTSASRSWAGAPYSTGVLLHVEIRVRPGSLTPEARRSRAFGSPFQHDARRHRVSRARGRLDPGRAAVGVTDAGLAPTDPCSPTAGAAGPTRRPRRPSGSRRCRRPADWASSSRSLRSASPRSTARSTPRPLVGGEPSSRRAVAMGERAGRARGMPPERDLEPGGWFERHRQRAQITTTAEPFGIRSWVQIRSIAGSVTRAQPCEAGNAGTLV